MDHNGISNPTIPRGQNSIRSFFQPKTPQYSAPPTLKPSQTSPPVPEKPKYVSPPPTSPLPFSNTSNPNSKSPPLQQTSILPIEQHHIQPLRRINSLLLPISYPDSFYHKILSTNLSRIILWNEPSPKVIGGIVCRLDPSLSPTSAPQQPQYIEGSFDVYIQSLALLSPYREKGLASQALESVIAGAVTQKQVRIRDLYAHVWTENEEALKWYTARGFKREEPVIQGYYQRLKPNTAWILRRRVSPSDHLAHGGAFLPDKEVRVNENEDEGPKVGELKERPGNVPHTKSFQDRRPDMEWNDLPEDVLRDSRLLKPGSSAASAASSRSSSRSGLDGKGKKKRQYPAAAFGS